MGFENLEVNVASHCIVFLSHVINGEIKRRFERLLAEAPRGFDVFFLLNTATPPAKTSQEDGDEDPSYLIRVLWSDLQALPYPGKCRDGRWSMHGKADLLFLQTWRLKPDYDFYWFMEYDVHYEGRWEVFFDYFANSAADVLATIIYPAPDVPNIVEIMVPPLSFPKEMPVLQGQVLKAFFPICRLSRMAMHCLDQGYRRGIEGHYELTVATVAAFDGLLIEDIGGRGPYVRPVNKDRFYFANPSSYTHSPGTFVFRPAIARVLRYKNTLWHPVKPEDTPAWFPLRTRGSVRKNLLELLKEALWPVLIWLWFRVRWNPLP